MTVVYSYIPFLQDSHLIDENDESKIEHVKKSHISGLAYTCCWTDPPNGPMVILIYRGAKAIYEDLMNFCKKRPDLYFNLEFGCSDDGYAISLTPDHKNWVRVNNNLRMMQGKAPLMDDVKVVYSPLHFCCYSLDVLDEMDIENELSIGLMDERDFEANEGLDSSTIMTIGTFNLSDNPTYVKRLIDQMYEMSTAN